MQTLTFYTALDNELHDGKGIACETFIPTLCTAMLVKNAVQLTLVAGDVSKAPARLTAPTRTPRDDREGANTPIIVDLTRGSPRAQASAEKELNLQIRSPGEGHSSAIEILGEGGARALGTVTGNIAAGSRGWGNEVTVARPGTQPLEPGMRGEIVERPRKGSIGGAQSAVGGTLGGHGLDSQEDEGRQAGREGRGG